MPAQLPRSWGSGASGCLPATAAAAIQPARSRFQQAAGCCGTAPVCCVSFASLAAMTAAARWCWHAGSALHASRRWMPKCCCEPQLTALRQIARAAAAQVGRAAACSWAGLVAAASKPRARHSKHWIEKSSSALLGCIFCVGHCCYCAAAFFAVCSDQSLPGVDGTQ